jgi:hypothetical protein
VRESRKGKHHSAGEVTHALSSSRLSSSPLLSGGEVTRSATSPPHPKGVRPQFFSLFFLFNHLIDEMPKILFLNFVQVSFEARNDTDSEPLTSDSEGSTSLSVHLFIYLFRFSFQ